MYRQTCTQVGSCIGRHALRHAVVLCLQMNEQGTLCLLTKVTEQEHELTILILELAARREDFTVSDFVIQLRVKGIVKYHTVKKT